MTYTVTNKICKTYNFKFPIAEIPFQSIIDNSQLFVSFFDKNEYVIKSIILKNDYNMDYGIAEFEIEKDWLLTQNESDVKDALKRILKEYFNLPSLTYKSFNVDYEEKIPALKIFLNNNEKKSVNKIK